ncbi:MAG: bacillithiol biosynthesis cysteine-adding enzyme BshC [Gemmatimonadaceae bacterium]
MSHSVPRVIAESLGGSPLARAAIAGRLPEWYSRRPSSPDEWRDRAQEVRDGVGSDASWYTQLHACFDASGAAKARLDRVARAGGVVVTTGQQPGLFGGPIYTLSKALSALELADAIETETGIPTAPVFWAATDDADFAEAASTWVPLDGGAVLLTQDQAPTDGIPVAEVPLDGIEHALEQLLRSAGSAANVEVLDAVREAYGRGATMGGAYLRLLRRILHPLGIGVIDASHPALLEREREVLVDALRRSEDIARELGERERALREQGYATQVSAVDGLTLVFARAQDRKVRVPVSEARAVAARAAAERLSPNVLLRPVVERAVLPTVAYVAGPGELAYFAQVSAVATALDRPLPLAVPRWSCTILEPHVETTLARLGVAWRELETAHAVERRLAVASMPLEVMASLDQLRASAQSRGEAFKETLARSGALIDPRIVDGTVRGMMWRVQRLERRVIAAAKRREHDVMKEIGTARGSLYPGGKRQERALTFVPFLATYGDALVERMRASAHRHADALVRGQDFPVDP